MKASSIDLAVARVTGETAQEIRHRGFSLIDFEEVHFDPEPDDRPPQIVDWDQLDLRRS